MATSKWAEAHREKLRDLVRAEGFEWWDNLTQYDEVIADQFVDLVMGWYDFGLEAGTRDGANDPKVARDLLRLRGLERGSSSNE